MAHSSSSQELRNRPLQSSGSAIRTVSAIRVSSRSKCQSKKDKSQQAPASAGFSGKHPLRFVASLQTFTQMGTVQRSRQRQSSSIGSMLYLDTADTCKEEPPVTEQFTVRKYNDKIVRDVLIDTHDLINEPGGFVINLAHHGQPLNSNEIKIHLGIKEKRQFGASSRSSSGIVRPGTITTTDDYAREIYRAVRVRPQLTLLTAILEINDDEDLYEQKAFEDMPPEFLRKFIQTYPQTLTKFHVEIPGVSPVYLPEWKFLLDQQTTLKVLICNFGVVMWNFYLKSIITNSKTLERVVLRRLQTYDITDASYLPMDWSLFAECVKLTYLKVTCGFRNITNLSSPFPPCSVFLHENLDMLPDHDTFEQLHLANIWVERCVIDEFCMARPHLRFCGKCNDLEYYDGDKICQDDKGLWRGRQEIRIMTQISQVDVQAEFSESFTKASPRRSRQKQLALIVLALFHVIIMALAVLFIIIFFRHLRNNNDTPKNSKKSLI